MNFKAPAVVSYIIAYASFHVEDVAKDLPLLEGAEPEAEFPLQPEEVIEDQEQALEQDLTDSFSQQGKHRFIYPSILHKFRLYASPGSFIPFKSKSMQAPVHDKPSYIYN